MAEEKKYPRRIDAIMAYLRGLLEKEEDPKKKQNYEKSIAELINFGGDYEEKAKGGLLMDEQMSMFNEGGLFDEGGEVDEESGNDVPIGGTKEGVRDDIPAMLSEGEFVFPEDVTRYHGLEKLMTLRQEAKMGLKKMEAMGQMGNSEEATIPDDLPFTMDDLILVVGEKEPKEKDDEPIKAQAGTFVPANQQLNNMGVMGFQESMYGQQGLQNPVETVIPQVPASSIVPTVQAPQVGGYSAPTVPATPVQQTDFVPPIDQIYKSVKYINPTTGETMMINEYQGNPVSAVPAGFIRYDNYIAQGGKDPSQEEGVTTGVESTSVETAQTAGARDDESKAKASNLEKMREDRERKRVQEYNRVFDTESKSFTDKNDPNYITNEQLIDAYKDQMEAETIAPLIPGVGLFAAGMTRLGRGKMNKALAARFGKNFKENPEFMKLTEGVTRGSVLRGAGADIIQGFKDAFDPEFYDNYKAKYNIKSYDKTRTGTGFNLTAREQQAFDLAIDRGDDAIANHFSLIAQSRNAKDAFARQNARDIKLAQDGDQDAYDRLMSNRQQGNVRLGASSIDEIIKFGSSTTTAIKMGKAEQGKGLFGKATPTNNTPITSTSTSMASTKQTTTVKPKPQMSSGAGDDPLVASQIAQAAADQKAAREAASAARERLRAQAERDRRRRDREQSISRTQPSRSRPQLTKKEISKAKASTKKTSSRRRFGGGGKAKGGLMKKDK